MAIKLCYLLFEGGQAKLPGQEIFGKTDASNSCPRGALLKPKPWVHVLLAAGFTQEGKPAWVFLKILASDWMVSRENKHDTNYQASLVLRNT